MRVARDVAREKYDQELAVLNRRFDVLASLGCYVVRAEFPNIDVIVTPSRAIRIGHIPLGAGAKKGANGEPIDQEVMIPTYGLHPRLTFSLRAFGVRIGLADYDLHAPSYSFRDPLTWELAPAEHLPAAMLEHEGRQMLVMLVHPLTKTPFFCMQGVREYHEHPEHTGDEWLLYRGSKNVYSTLTEIVRCCQRVAPILLIHPPQLGLQWEVG